MVALAIELMDVHLAFDDPGGTVAVHFLSGLWGLLATGLFGSGSAIAQVAGDCQVAWSCTSAGIPGGVVDRTILRTAPEGDRQGMDLHELRFVTHHEDTWGR